MSEQKKRGRPTNAEIAARAAQVPVAPAVVQDPRERAQAYAMRVWAGQALDMAPAERVARVVRALQGQGLPTDGIKYPREEQFRDDGDDDEPVTWRMKLPRPEGIV